MTISNRNINKMENIIKNNNKDQYHQYNIKDLLHYMNKARKYKLFEFSNSWENDIRVFKNLILILDATFCGDLFDADYIIPNSLETFPQELIDHIKSFMTCEVKSLIPYGYNFKCNKNNSRMWFREKNIFGNEYGPIIRKWGNNSSNINKCVKIKEMCDKICPGYKDYYKHYDSECKCQKKYILCCGNTGTIRSKYEPIKEESDILEEKQLFKVFYELSVRKLNPNIYTELCFCDSLIFRKNIIMSKEQTKIYNELINTRYYSNNFDHSGCYYHIEDYDSYDY
ncbi:hypothetical protein [Dasineura jujubifolia toursvirus 2a]|nr:hypothetical protein [Dasineura jujubifolia toursvirus 2a]